MKRLIKLFIIITLVILVTACQAPPQVSAEQRIFLDLSLEFLGEYKLPKIKFQDTSVGGISGITYDPQKNLFYAVSDDRGELAKPRFYTFNVLFSKENERIKIDEVKVIKVTTLVDLQGRDYPRGAIDLEGIALSPTGTIFISSEGNVGNGIPPFIGEFDLKTGKQLKNLPIPERYLPDSPQTKGVRDNLAFESLTISSPGLATGDPYRLFAATESNLVQDTLADSPEVRIRLMHYLIDAIGSPSLVAEHVYLLEPGTSDVLNNGLSELTTLNKEGFLLSLERTLGLAGFGVKIFQVANAGATDTSKFINLQPEVGAIKPLEKKLLLDLSTLGIELDNLEGMTLGPRLADGSQSLLLVSDDNFTEEQVTQFLLFRLQEK